jgi:phospholipase C
MTGFRVPFIVVAPCARAHFASHTVHDHAAIPRFIEARFELPAFTNRDANTAGCWRCSISRNPLLMTLPNITAHTVAPPRSSRSASRRRPR